MDERQVTILKEAQFNLANDVRKKIDRLNSSVVLKIDCGPLVLNLCQVTLFWRKHFQGHRTSYLSHPEEGSRSRVGVSGSFLDIISYHNFCPDRNTKFSKIPPDRNFGLIRMFFELRMGFRIKFSGLLR